MKFRDITGFIYGRITVIKLHTEKRNKAILWVCKCECGKELYKSISELNSGSSRSCGCLANELTSLRAKTHGCSKNNKIYSVWQSMKRRCYGVNTSLYYRYGGRGIKVCDRWKDSFQNFYDDVHEGYQEGLQLDRFRIAPSLPRRRRSS